MRYATAGKVLGALGVVTLLSTPFTLVISAGSSGVAAAKAVVGLVFIGCYFATHWATLGQYASKKSTFFFASSAGLVLCVAAALVALNYVAGERNRAWDFTLRRMHSLSPQTVTALKALHEKVKVTAFFDVKNPYYAQLADLLELYRRQAPDHFEYVFTDAVKNPQAAKQYDLRAGELSVIVEQGPLQARLSGISEQDLTNALLQLQGGGERKAYFVIGHGEWTLEALAAHERVGSISELKQSLLQEGCAVEPLNLLGRPEIPRDASVLVLAGPKNRLTEGEVATLRAYLAEGGRLLYFADANAEGGLDGLLAEYGVQVDPGLVADERSAPGTPYVISTAFYSDHEITQPLRRAELNATFTTVRGLSLLHEGLAPGVRVDPVVLSAASAWEESTPDDAPAASSGEKRGQIPLVVASARNTAGAANKRFDEARLVVFGDSELLLNAQWGQEANRNLTLNAVAWSSQRAARITIRPPDRQISSVEFDPQLLGRVRFFATDLFPLALLALGLAIWVSRRNA